MLGLSAIDDVGVVAYLAAFGAGVLSFLSPCVLPLVPAYLSIVTGLDVATIEDGGRANARRITVTTGLFIAGFGTVFVLLGLTASGIGQTLADHKETLTRATGAVMLGMALFMLGSLFLRAPWLYREMRFHPRLGRFGAATPLVAGAAFGFGWSPCIGPLLGSILGIAATQDRMLTGATLLSAYTIGLGVPFLASGLALGRLGGALAWAKRHFAGLVFGAALVLAAFGVLLVLDRLERVTAELTQALEGTPLEWIAELSEI